MLNQEIKKNIPLCSISTPLLITFLPCSSPLYAQRSSLLPVVGYRCVRHIHFAQMNSSTKTAHSSVVYKSTHMIDAIIAILFIRIHCLSQFYFSSHHHTMDVKRLLTLVEDRVSDHAAEWYRYDTNWSICMQWWSTISWHVESCSHHTVSFSSEQN